MFNVSHLHSCLSYRISTYLIIVYKFLDDLDNEEEEEGILLLNAIIAFVEIAIRLLILSVNVSLSL